MWGSRDSARQMTGRVVWWTVVVCLVAAGSAWAAEASGHGGSMWPDFWKRVLNFAIMVAVLYFIARKPVRDFFVKRTKTIANTLADLEAKKKEAEKTYEEYNKKLAELDKETERILQEYVRQGEEEKARIIANAEAAAAEIKRQAELAIQHEIKMAKSSLQQEIAELSVAAATRLLQEKMSEQDQRKLVDEFLEKVVEAK